MVKALSAALQKVLGRPDVQQKFAAQGFAADWMTPDDTRGFVGDEVKKWAEVVRASGATVN
ncbi:Tripartite tricarboxylate transporter family receptor [compost metagenome]